ncbi:MAG TPA: endo-1,4-beta-xylanase [Fibrobacteria bacterium]|nr:endo-1,4-beta-xylanase [Fibrobacteria bacterium]
MERNPSRSTLGRNIALGIACLGAASHAQMAKNATKFLGNITTSGSVRAGYATYWNQITGENEHKWSSVEGTRNSMNWRGGDAIRDYAEKNNMPWKFHTLVWGSQYPGEPNTQGMSAAEAWQKKMTSGWLMQLSKADQLKEITEWYDAAAARYPNVDMIDVVNEAYMSDVNDPTKGKHAPPPFRDALGGTGATGYDWIVTAFKMARQRWPKAILIYNDYNTLEWGNEINWIKQIIPKLVAAGAPIDAVGFQAHGLKGTSATTLKSRLDDIANAIKLPMFITEYDIGNSDDNGQKNDIAAQFPVMWNHPKVVGITYWGYIMGRTWVTGTGLMSDANVERPSLVWMKDFVAKNPNPPCDYPEMAKRLKKSSSSVATGRTGRGPVAAGLLVRNLQGRMVMGIERDGVFQEVSALGRN